AYWSVVCFHWAGSLAAISLSRPMYSCTVLLASAHTSPLLLPSTPQPPVASTSTAHTAATGTAPPDFTPLRIQPPRTGPRRRVSSLRTRHDDRASPRIRCPYRRWDAYAGQRFGLDVVNRLARQALAVLSPV